VSISDLLFLLLILLTLIALVAVVVALVRARWRTAGRWAAVTAGVWAVYLLAGLAVAVLTPQTVLGQGEERCFDEMCFRVTAVEKLPSLDLNGQKVISPDALYQVTVETTNRGLGRTQSEGGAEAFLVDAAGRRYKPTTVLGDGLDARVAPGGKATTELVFSVPASAPGIGLVIAHSYWLNPGKIIIGDPEHFGHKPTMNRLRE
jgi:hypothetical protein